MPVPTAAEYAQAVWEYATRTLASGTSGPPADAAGEYAEAVWGYGTRTLTSMPGFVNDTFTDADGTALTAHTGEVGATWTAKSGNGTITGNRLRRADAGGGIFYASGVPASAEYDVEADFFAISSTDMDSGLMGRIPTASDDGYLLQAADSGYYLYKRVGGTFTLLDSDTTSPILLGQTKAVKLELRDAAKKGYVDGVEILTTADNAVAAAGRAGLRIDAGSATTGIHVDNFVATDLASPGVAGTGAGRGGMRLGFGFALTGRRR